MIQGFKDFLLRGNIVDLAVAVVIGTAFTALVTKFTESFINPLIAATGSTESGLGLGFSIRHGSPAAEAATRIDIGGFLNGAITFAITAAVVYFFVVVPMKKINERRAQGKEPEPEGPSEDIALLREIRDSLQRPIG